MAAPRATDARAQRAEREGHRHHHGDRRPGCRRSPWRSRQAHRWFVVAGPARRGAVHRRRRAEATPERLRERAPAGSSRRATRPAARSNGRPATRQSKPTDADVRRFGGRSRASPIACDDCVAEAPLVQGDRHRAELRPPRPGLAHERPRRGDVRQVGGRLKLGPFGWSSAPARGRKLRARVIHPVARGLGSEPPAAGRLRSHPGRWWSGSFGVTPGLASSCDRRGGRRRFAAAHPRDAGVGACHTATSVSRRASA
jgi:hypothetical protein